MKVMKTSTAYLSVSTVDGDRRWSMPVREVPMIDNATLPEVLALAKRVFGNAIMRLWDGDVGEFVAEMTTGPYDSDSPTCSEDKAQERAMDKYKGNFDLSELWDQLRTPILYLMEDDSEAAVNEAGAVVRHFAGDWWLYRDEIDGHGLLKTEEMMYWPLATEDDPRIRNKWDGEGNVYRDGKLIGKAVD